MALVTVITPTYNRAAKLLDLYASLKKQTSRNFEWLIVDDGSTDDTGHAANKFRSEADFSVRYIHKENGGKHTALNIGIREIKTKLTFIVDSDDTVMPDGIATIEEYYERYKDEPNLGVISFLRYNTSNGVSVKMPKDEFVGSYVEDRVRNHVPGDMAEVFLTSALQEFPFPEFDGEKFLSEDVVWIPLGLKYKTVFINKPIYLFEYLEDGLTNNDKRHKFASPMGSVLRGKMLMKKECGWKANLRGAIIYNCYKREIKGSLLPCLHLKKKTDEVLVAVLAPAGALFNHLWKRK